MLGMVLRRPRTPLVAEVRPDPEPGPGEVRLRVRACRVCRTDLHVADGDLATHGAVIPGHEIVGRVDAIGPGVTGMALGERRGVPWLGGTCGRCAYCREGRENLCDAPEFTGWTRDGGYADTVIARADYCFPLPDSLSDTQAAPLLCAGLIGFRAWRLAPGGRQPGAPAPLPADRRGQPRAGPVGGAARPRGGGRASDQDGALHEAGEG